MSEPLQQMMVFARLVGAGSLSAAARELGLSPAAASRSLAALESRLGVRLVNRTTRRLSLTEEGQRFHESCVRILAELDEAEAAVTPRGTEPQGVLKVAAPGSFGQQYIAPLVPRFSAAHPGVRLALALSDRVVNVFEEGYDLAIRIAELEDSSLVARKLAPNRRVVCASPEYLARHGMPRSPQDLARHHCIVRSWEHDFSEVWDYKDAQGRPGSVRVSGRLACDHWTVIGAWAGAGVGIALKSTWDIRRQLEQGSLVPLLTDWSFESGVAIYAVYPHRRFLSAKVRAFVDFLAESFGPEPSWDRPARVPARPGETAAG